MSTFSENEIQRHEENDEKEIDLIALFYAVLDKVWAILIAALAVGVIALLYTKILVTPIYQSSTTVYMLTKTQDAANNVTTSNLQLSTLLTQDYQQLILSRSVLEEVIKEVNLDTTYAELKNNIAVSTPENTRMLQISVSDPDPKMAQDIANSVREISAERIREVMDVQSVNTVDEANLAVSPSSPNVMKNTLIGGILGGFVAVAIVVLQFMMDDRIKTVEDVEKYLGIGVLGSIPFEEKTGKKKAAASKSGTAIQKKRR